MPTLATAPQVIEGTWEEVSRQGARLNGHRVRVEILPDAEPANHPNAPLIALLKLWEEEDARMSPEDLQKANATYDEIEKNSIPRVKI